MKYRRKSCEFPPKFGGFDFIGWLYVVMVEHQLYRKTLNSCYVVFSRRKQQDYVAGLEAMATVLPPTQLFPVLHQTLSRRPNDVTSKNRRRDSGLATRDY